MRRSFPSNVPGTVGVAAIVALTVTGCGFTATPADADSVDTTLTEAIADLPVEDEVRDGYDRDKFPHWVDVDDDGCNARYEVLIAEAVTAPDVGSGCRLTGGKWTSYYDGEEWTEPADLDVDHFVPLAESWDSGSRDWSQDDRERFANDLDEERGLAAVTDNVNQSKGDKDPAEWLPPLEKVHCRYLQEWTVVKSRWRLSVDQEEKDKLEELADGCDNVKLSFEYAI